jgi:LPS-assembly protein
MEGKQKISFMFNQLWISRAGAAGAICAAVLMCSTPVLSMTDTSLQLNKTDPVLLEAKQMGYDKINAIVVAQGDVEIVQNDYIVRADQVTYNQNTSVVRATGNVSVMQPDGNVYFAQDVELQDKLKSGVVQNFRARLKDNSVFAAREGRRINENVTEMEKAVYSPCKLCEGKSGEAKSPLWQIKSDHVKVDEAEQNITYRNAYFEVYGVPVLYTPYFSHPTPNADNKSGILTPEYGHTTNLGTTVQVPVYLSFAPNMDLTLTPMYTTKEGSVLSAEWRHLTENGYYQLKGSGTYPDKRSDTGATIAGKEEFRGHIEGDGRLSINDDFAWGFNFKRTTDDTYLRRYRFGEEYLLTSRVYAEGLRDRNYAIVQALAFQGLKVGDDPDRSPLIVPMLDTRLETDPLWMGSRFTLDGNALVLTREEGSETRRVGLIAGWKLPVVTEAGHVFEAKASVRAEGIDVQDNLVPTNTGTRKVDGNQSRVVPEVEIGWRYPLIRRFSGGESLTLEPIVKAMASPSRTSSIKIPNEDSQVREFADTNLFSENRFAGWDDLETGPRVAYGVRSQLSLDETKRMRMLIGQTYQSNDENRFPLTENLSNHYSDIVGEMGLTYDMLDLSYRFKLDKEEWDMQKNEVNAVLGWKPITMGVNYVHVNDEPFSPDFEDLSGFTNIAINDNWSLSGSARRDMRNKGGMIHSSGALSYTNECITVMARLAKEYTRDRDIEPDTSFTVRFGLKNLE